MVQLIGGLLKVALPFFCSCFLKPCSIGLGIEFESFLRIGECLGRVSGAIVVRAQVHMSGDELSLALLIKRYSFLISLKRSRIISESLLSKTQRVDGLDIRRIQPERLLELLAGSQPVVLKGKQFAKVVVALARVWSIVNGLFEFGLCGVKTTDRHEIAAENFMGVCVLHIQAQRIG